MRQLGRDRPATDRLLLLAGKTIPRNHPCQGARPSLSAPANRTLPEPLAADRASGAQEGGEDAVRALAGLQLRERRGDPLRGPCLVSLQPAPPSRRGPLVLAVPFGGRRRHGQAVERRCSLRGEALHDGVRHPTLCHYAAEPARGPSPSLPLSGRRAGGGPQRRAEPSGVQKSGRKGQRQPGQGPLGEALRGDLRHEAREHLPLHGLPADARRALCRAAARKPAGAAEHAGRRHHPLRLELRGDRHRHLHHRALRPALGPSDGGGAHGGRLPDDAHRRTLLRPPLRQAGEHPFRQPLLAAQHSSAPTCSTTGPTTRTARWR